MSSGDANIRAWKAVRSFFGFWKDFLLGDSPVLALGVIGILAVAYLIRNSTIYAPVAVVALVVALMAFVVWHKVHVRSSNQ